MRKSYWEYRRKEEARENFENNCKEELFSMDYIEITDFDIDITHNKKWDKKGARVFKFSNGIHLAVPVFDDDDFSDTISIKEIRSWSPRCKRMSRDYSGAIIELNSILK